MKATSRLVVDKPEGFISDIKFADRTLVISTLLDKGKFEHVVAEYIPAAQMAAVYDSRRAVLETADLVVAKSFHNIVIGRILNEIENTEEWDGTKE